MIKKTLISLGFIALLAVAFFAGTNVNAVKAAKADSFTSPSSLFDRKTYPTYVVHGIPGVPVDVYVNKKLTLPNFQPGTTAGPFNLPAGFYTIALYPVGANPDTTPAIVNTPVPVQSTLAPVSLVARLNYRGRPSIDAINELADFAIFPGQGMLAVRDASTNSIPFNFCYSAVGSGRAFNSPIFSGQYVKAGNYNVFAAKFGDITCQKPVVSTTVTVNVGEDLNAYVVGDQASGTLQIIGSAIKDEGDNR